MLRIQLTKRVDGGALLRCIRADGTVTWQKQEGQKASFFPLHDLTHFAVESTLGFHRGFYGLIAEGWDIEETAGKGSRGPVPGEGVEVEHVAGLFDSERASAAIWTVAEWNASAELQAASANREAPRRLSEEDLVRVRKLRGELFGAWASLEPGATLELNFAPYAGATA